MFDIGWSEMAVVVLIALIVIGPKELPQAMRMAAKWVRKARGLAREFQSGVDEMIREAELEDARKAIDTARHINVDKALEDTVDPTGSVREEQRDLDKLAKSGTAVADATPAQGETDGGTVPAEGAKAAPAAEAAEGAEQEGATVVTQPLNIAPPHSVTPPAEAEASRPGDAAPADSASDNEPANERTEPT